VLYKKIKSWITEMTSFHAVVKYAKHTHTHTEREREREREREEWRDEEGEREKCSFCPDTVSVAVQPVLDWPMLTLIH
jgi:hypothetical protein